MPFTVALTGGIGSGKSAVADLFAARGAAVIDTDVIAHALTGPGAAGSRALADAFGADCLGADGALDRLKMRERAFGDPAAKARLEAILHPMIRAQALAQAAAATAAYLLMVVPLLTATSAYAQQADRVLVVDCPEALQVARVVQRSGLTTAQVQAIMATQPTRAGRLAMADDVVTNDGPREALPPAVDALHARYLALAHAKKAR
ncbi:MAG: dephospho-CoA kinase [Burkholderiales bacterium]